VLVNTAFGSIAASFTTTVSGTSVPVRWSLSSVSPPATHEANLERPRRRRPSPVRGTRADGVAETDRLVVDVDDRGPVVFQVEMTDVRVDRSDRPIGPTARIGRRASIIEPNVGAEIDGVVTSTDAGRPCRRIDVAKRPCRSPLRITTSLRSWRSRRCGSAAIPGRRRRGSDAVTDLFFATAESGVDHDEVAHIAQWNVPVKGRRAVAVGGPWQPSCVCLDAGTATIRVDAIRRWPAGPAEAGDVVVLEGELVLVSGAGLQTVDLGAQHSTLVGMDCPGCCDDPDEIGERPDNWRRHAVDAPPQHHRGRGGVAAGQAGDERSCGHGRLCPLIVR